jgi:hypothetical protein
MKNFIALIACATLVSVAVAQQRASFKVIAFYTARADLAHISFVHEANEWFPRMGATYGFTYDSTNDWNNLNADFLSRYQVVIFLDTRPDSAAPRAAFQQYMENGGAWMGFHFAGFALDHSLYPQNWPWYHDQLMGVGEYKGNSWRPVPAILRVEQKKHEVTKHVPETFRSAPSEWYSWKKDIRNNPDIKILLSVDSTSFPLGTGPKPHEIWHNGYYPIAWTHTKYHMLYFNWGHNDMDYESKTNRALSSTFSSEQQNKVIIDGLLWLAKISKK